MDFFGAVSNDDALKFAAIIASVLFALCGTAAIYLFLESDEENGDDGNYCPDCGLHKRGYMSAEQTVDVDHSHCGRGK